MSEMDVDEIKNNIYNSLLKNKSKDGLNDETSNKNKRVVFQDKPVILNKLPQKVTDIIAPRSESNEHDKSREKKERNRPPTKVVVRRLPPTMTLDVFIDYVSPLPEHDYIYFVRADLSLGPNSFSRVYINFVNMEDLLTFHEQFDNYVFMDTKGNEFPAVVEFSPFQRVPKKRVVRKKDPKTGTLKEDPAFISFLASLKEKMDTSAMKQASAEHLMALTTESSVKKDTTTPLLEFIKQRRAERQRVRDEKREERRRKELERKRIKDEERRRRKDSDSVLKVLRNPEHEDKEDASKVVKERERPQQGMRKREEERQKHRDREKKDRQIQDNRQRDIKGRDVGPRSYREDRQKMAEGRMQRRMADDQRKKTGSERTQGQNKLTDTRRSQEFERQGHSKETDTRKSQGNFKDTEQKKGINERYQGHSKENERHSRDPELRKNYKDSDVKRNQGYVRDFDHRKNSYGSEQRKVSHSYSESDTRKRSADYKAQLKDNESKQVKESKVETIKAQTVDETGNKKWELLGAKPKRKNSENLEEKKVESVEVKDSLNVNFEGNDDLKGTLKRRNSLDSSDHKRESHLERADEEGSRKDSKRRNSLELESHSLSERSNDFKPELRVLKPKRQSSLDPDAFMKESNLDSCRKGIPVSKSQEFEKNANIENYIRRRRNSLDSGDHEMGSQSKKERDQSLTDNEFLSGCKLKRNYSLELQGSQWERKVGHADRKHEERMGSMEKDGGDAGKSEDDKGTEGSGTDTDRKRDPRLERRIRNKDRPSMEIYRPGMGRFSLQRKDREKGPGVGSSTEQDSPSTSPSPTPSVRPIPTKVVAKTSQELRSMTFKRSVSREK